MKKKEESKQLTPEEFVFLALEKLKKPEHKGIHAVYSGFNEAFREYFPQLDPVKTMKELAANGKIKIRPTRGGAVIYPAGEEVTSTDAEQTLKKMGLV